MATQKVSGVSPYEPIFGYSRAVRRGNQIFVSGTAAVGDDGKTVGVGDPAAQMRRCVEIVEKSLGALGASLEDVVRVLIYVTDASHADPIGRVHREFFGEIRPALTMVTTGMIHPEWLLEMEVNAVVEDV